MTIGIPRALVYWKMPLFWETFFEQLGLKVLLSPKTNKEIVKTGSELSDPEACFSIKVYLGHLNWLEGKCDMIFVPRLKADKRHLEYCPRFFGLPDLAKIISKTPILTETFDQRKETFEKTIAKIGRALKKSKAETDSALRAGLFREKKEREEKEKQFLEKINLKKKKVILVSHPYNLYDDYVNMGIKGKLEELGVLPIFIDWAPLSDKKLSRKDWPNFHWEFAEEIARKIETLLEYQPAGAIEVSSFACGSDAVIKEFVEKRFKKAKVPFLYLIIDEQTGEAGFQTRLEAFVDTIG